MDRTEELRAQAKQQYTALRRSLSSFEDRVVAQRWSEDAVVRSGFGYLLGSLDRLAGWALSDDELSRRGEDLMRRTGSPAGQAGSEARGEISGGLQEPEAEQRAADETESPARPQPAGQAPDDAAKPDSVDVTFTLPSEVRAGSVALCGDFNQWSAEAVRLERGTDGTWRTTVALEPGRSYRYRFLIDGERWENDWRADRYEPNPYGGTDSVVIVEPRQES